MLNIIAYLIESFVLVYTFYSIYEKTFDIKSIILILLTTLLITCMNYLAFPLYVQVLIMAFIYVLYLYLLFHSYRHHYFLYSLCLFILLAISRIVGNYCASFLSSIPKIDFVKHEYAYASSFVAILFFMAFAFLFHYLTAGKEKTKALNGRFLFGVNVFVMIAMCINLLESVIFTNFNIYTIYSLFIEFIILTICIISLYVKLLKQSKKSLEMSQKITRMQYQNQMYSIVAKVKDQLMNEKHMMLYNYMNMKLLLTSDNKKALKDFIDKEIDRMMKYKYVSSTGNALFDYTMTNKLNILNHKDIDAKTVFMLNRHNTLLENEMIVDYIMNSIDYMISFHVNKIEIFLNDYHQKYLLLKLIIYSDEKIEIKKEQFQHPYLKKINYKHDYSYHEVSILLG